MNRWWFISIAIIVEIILYSLFIKVFKKQKIGQSIRKEGPKSHINKKGTPTMGGVIFGILILIGYLLSLKLIGEPISIYPTLVIIVTILGYGILGFLDDYLIVIKHNNAGISPSIKFIIQVIIAVIVFFILLNNNHSTVINIFGLKFDFTFVYGLFIVIFLSGTTNAVNLTDGLDGLASGTIITILIGTAIYAYYVNNTNILVLSVVSIIFIIGFMFYNIHPAKIFMGNTGSMILGAIIAVIFIILKIEFLLLVMGMVLVIETLSDIIQVLYFKLTKGKRVFKMAPLHHHFELCGYSEWQIDLIFWMFSLVMSLVGVIIGVRLF
jgi:phospho-N-acetylmuramoyl-pentapeptide-transferase